MTRAYREREWEPVASSTTELSLQSYVEDYKRNGYEIELRHEQGLVRLYVRAALD